MSTQTNPKITPRPYHTLEKASFIITFRKGLSTNEQNQVLSLFEAIPREGVTIDRDNMTVTVRNGYIERNEHSKELTGYKTKCYLSVAASVRFTESVTYLDGTAIT